MGRATAMASGGVVFVDYHQYPELTNRDACAPPQSHRPRGGWDVVAAAGYTSRR